MLLNSGASEQHGEESSDGSLSLLHQDKKAQTTLFAQRALQERRLKPPDQIIACPRCQSSNTKFCYYNNYSLTQPRHFCKNCRRYWTAGGTLRNVPVGGGCRKNKRAKQRSSDITSVLTSADSSSVLRSDGGGAALHPGYNPANASSSAGFYDHQYEEATKIAIARAQLRVGTSGVGHGADELNARVSGFHVTHGSHPAPGLSQNSHSFETPSMINLAFFQPPTKQEVPALPSGDLSAIFESQSYRAATAAAAASGGGPALGDGSIAPFIDVESLHNMETADAQWRLQAHQAAQKQVLWEEEEQGHRERREVMKNVDEKGSMESLRLAKGKSAIDVSSSSGRNQSEPSDSSHPTNAPAWQQVSESMQNFQSVSHDTTFWASQAWPPLDNIHALNPPTNSQML